MLGQKSARGSPVLRGSPLSFQVSVCVIVPLALAFMLSIFLWDVICFNCGSDQQWRTSMMQAAKDKALQDDFEDYDFADYDSRDGEDSRGLMQGDRPDYVEEYVEDYMEDYRDDEDYDIETVIRSAFLTAKNGTYAYFVDDYPDYLDEDEVLGQEDEPENPEDYASLYDGEAGANGSGKKDEEQDGAAAAAGEDAADDSGADGAGGVEEGLDEADDVEDNGPEDKEPQLPEDKEPEVKESPEDEGSPEDENTPEDGDPGLPDETAADYESLYDDDGDGGDDAGETGDDVEEQGGDAEDTGDDGGEEQLNESDDVEENEPEEEKEEEKTKAAAEAEATQDAGPDASDAAKEVPDSDEDTDANEDATKDDDAPAEDTDEKGEDTGPTDAAATEGGAADAADDADNAPAEDDAHEVPDTDYDAAAAAEFDPDDDELGAPVAEGDGADDAAAGAAEEEEAPDEHKYGFKMLPPASLRYEDVEHCADAGEPAPEDVRAMHPGVNMLMVVGVQKGGTTWMSSALMKHPALVPAHHGYMLEKNHATKEIHYFDRWPHVNGSEETYMSLFPDATVRAAHDNATRQLEAAGISPETLTTAAGIRTAYRELSHEVAFFDASPNYFPVAHVAPRMHAVMPHARIVVVLRDPVARAMSAYNMDRGRFCEDDGSTSSRAPFLIPESVCPDTGFFDTVQQFVDAEDGGADDICTFTGQEGDAAKTWHDCYKCAHMFFQYFSCRKLPEPRPFNNCRPHVLNYVEVSNYAPQLAWWLAFFPPEQILILTSAELHDPDTQVNALNKILRHAKLPNARKFTRHWLDSLPQKPFAGSYDKEDTAVKLPEATAALREAFKKPTEDLRHLINTHWPWLNFTGLPDEI